MANHRPPRVIVDIDTREVVQQAKTSPKAASVLGVPSTSASAALGDKASSPKPSPRMMPSCLRGSSSPASRGKSFVLMTEEEFKKL